MKLVNLLPQARQELLKQESVFHVLLSLIWVSVFSFALVIAVQFGVKVYLQNQANAFGNSIQQLQTQVNREENASVKKQISDINNLAADYRNLAVAIPKWSRVIKAFAALPPDGVTINSFAVDFGTKSIAITGNSPSRDLVIRLYNDILSDDKEFYNIDYPLENVAKPTDISFHFSFNVRDGLLK